MKKNMKKKKYLTYTMIFLFVTSLFVWGGYFSGTLPEAKAARTSPLIINHNDATLSGISETAINNAKENFRIYYNHTSHGSQIIEGLRKIEEVEGGVYKYHTSGTESNSLYIDDHYESDLGHPDGIDDNWVDGEHPDWYYQTIDALEADSSINMVMWAWCAGVQDATEAGINRYFEEMTDLENRYPNVTFVYMTGHLYGDNWSAYGTKANSDARNEQIRRMARENNKVLYDFEDIESYDPDGNFHDDQDTCDWCDDWCASHPSSPYCGYCADGDCCAHTDCFNCSLKGKAFWNMMAQLAGSSSDDDSTDDTSTTEEDTASRTTEEGNTISPKIITTSGPGEVTRMQVYDRKGNPTGEEITNLFPESYTGGAGVVSIDSNNNGVKDQALIFAMNNGGPQARLIGIKEDKTISYLGQQFVFDSSIRDGLSATSGDFDNDGFQDDAAFCLTGDKAPEVSVYTDVSGIDNWTLAHQFEAPFQDVGCNLGTFQYDSGGDDLLVTPNHGPADPNVFIYWVDGTLQKQFPAYPQGVQSGLTPSGIGERIYTTPNNGSSQINVFDREGTRQNFWWAYQEHIRGDYQNVPGDIDLDGKDELLISPIGSNGPQVLAFEPTGKWRTWPNFFAFNDETLRNGVGIAVIDNYHGVN